MYCWTIFYVTKCIRHRFDVMMCFLWHLFWYSINVLFSRDSCSGTRAVSCWPSRQTSHTSSSATVLRPSRRRDRTQRTWRRMGSKKHSTLVSVFYHYDHVDLYRCKTQARYLLLKNGVVVIILRSQDIIRCGLKVLTRNSCHLVNKSALVVFLAHLLQRSSRLELTTQFSILCIWCIVKKNQIFPAPPAPTADIIQI